MEELEIKKPEKLLTPIANYWNAIFANHLTTVRIKSGTCSLSC